MQQASANTAKPATKEKPPAAGANKFSSWAQKETCLDELDELLDNDDFLNDHKTLDKKLTKPSAEQKPLDIDEVLDEFAQSPDPEAKLNKNKSSLPSLSYDLDNSDELNRFISKYETMLTQDEKTKKSALVQSKGVL